MNHINFEGANLKLGPPAGSKPGEVDTLFAFRSPDGTIASAWKPTAEELAALNAGAHVILTVWGTAHPPVSMHVQQMREVAMTIHALTGDHSQTVCGLPLVPLEGHLWTGDVQRVNCPRCVRSKP